MFGLGTPELIIIMGIAFLVFGGKKLPEIGAGLGKGINAFKRGLNEAEDVGLDLKKSIPGVKEVTAVKEKVDKARDITKVMTK